MALKIESVQNDKIKNAVKLAQSARARAQQGLFFLEGLRLCSDLLNSSLSVDTVFYTAALRDKAPDVVASLCGKAAAFFEITPNVSQKLTQTQTPQGVFCLASMPKPTDRSTLSPNGLYIALEGIQDPANLGAICRTAEALGMDGAVICGCCDAFSPKALRASMGSLLRLKLFFCDDLCAFLTAQKERGMRILAATPNKNALSICELKRNGGAIAVIGNEANGVSPATMQICEQVTIPMGGRAESLNASMASAIVMWELLRAKREEHT